MADTASHSGCSSTTTRSPQVKPNKLAVWLKVSIKPLSIQWTASSNKFSVQT